MLIKQKKRRKIFILGIDGATFDVIRSEREKHRFPALSQLCEEGSFGYLESTVHPLTPQAWTSFLTGKNPGKHGIYDFGRRREGTYRIDLVNSRDRKTSGFWDILKSMDMRVGVLNIPLTFPPEKLNGFMVTGMHTPSIEKAVYPSELYRDITSACPGYIIDAMSFWYESMDLFLQNVWEMMNQRLKLVKYLYKKFYPDCFVCNFVGVDRVQHALWNEYRQKDGKNNPVSNAYAKMDEIVFEIRHMLDEETVLLVISDHGFGHLEKDVYINYYLINEGFMRLKPNRKIPEINDKKDLSNPFESVDWSKTKAYSHGLFGNVYINLEGREPLGIVKKGMMYKEIRDSLIDKLYKMIDPEDGKPIVDEILLKEDIYSGEFLDLAPDLLLRMRDYAYITRGGCEFRGENLVSQPSVNHTGNHRMNGIFIACGEGIQPGYKLNDAEIIDLVPTMLYVLNFPIPYGVDGKILRNIFEN